MSDLKERIIVETTKMFSKEGIKAIRMDDIAIKLGISKRTIYELFTDKENLIIECVSYHHDIMEKKMEHFTRNASNIIEEFLLLMDAWEKDVDRDYNLMISVKKFYPSIHNKLFNKFYTESQERILEKLRKGVIDGYLLDTVNIELAMSIFSHTLYALFREEEMIPRNVSEKEAFNYVVTYFFRGIATDKGRDMIDQYTRKHRAQI